MSAPPRKFDPAKSAAAVAKAALIVAACLWIYSPVYDGEWLWDDDYLLTDNATVQSPDGLWKLWFAPATADYFPLTMSALWLMWRFFGMDSTGYHIVSILLHALGSCMVWALLARMRTGWAWFAGFVFAVHPLAVESVAWISELKNTLSLPLFLAAAWFWVRFDDQRKRPDYALALAFFILAMLGKSSPVMFPVVILLHAWWRRARIDFPDILRSAPFFVVSLVLGIVTLIFQHGRAIGDEPIPIGGFDSRLAIAGMAVLFYLGKILWPATLLPIYPQWDANPPTALQVLPWAAIAAAALVFWLNRKTWGRHAIMGFGFFFAMLLPVLGFVAMSYMRVGWVADHFVYIPMIGIVALAAAAGAKVFQICGPNAKPLLLGAAGAVAFALTASSHKYSAIWQNEERMWTYTLEYNFDCWQAHNRLGARKFNRGEIDPALAHFQEAVRLRPDLAETQNNLGSAILAKKDTKGAIRHFSEALRLSPDIIAIQSNLANALVLDANHADAAKLYADLAARFPANATFQCNLGVTLYRTGRTEEAVAAFRRALEIEPNLEDARKNLAIALGETETASQNQTPQP